MFLRLISRRAFFSLAFIIMLTIEGACARAPKTGSGPDPTSFGQAATVTELMKTEEIIPLMPDDFLKVGAILELAELNEVIGERLHAQKLIRDAEGVLYKVEVENCRQRMFFSLEIARIQIVMGEYTEAFGSVQNTLPCRGDKDTEQRDRILEKVAGYFIGENKFDEALEAVKEIGSEKYRYPLILELIDQKLSHQQVDEAVLLADTGNLSMKVANMVHVAESLAGTNSGSVPSVEMLREVSGIIDDISDPFQKILNLLLLARAEQGMERPERSLTSIQKAQSTLRGIDEDSNSKFLLHWALATTQIRLGDVVGALETLDSMEFPSDRAIGLLIVSLEKELSGDGFSGKDFMEMAVSGIEGVDDNFWKGFVYHTIGISLIKKRQMAEARNNFHMAEQYYSIVEAEEGKNMQLVRLAEKLNEQTSSLIGAENLDSAAAILKKNERRKNILPLPRAYLPNEGEDIFGGMDTVLLFEQESERILALSYIARILTVGGLEDKAFKLASIWDEPLIRFVVIANIAKGKILTVQNPNRNLLQILNSK